MYLWIHESWYSQSPTHILYLNSGCGRVAVDVAVRVAVNVAVKAESYFLCRCGLMMRLRLRLRLVAVAVAVAVVIFMLIPDSDLRALNIWVAIPKNCI